MRLLMQPNQWASPSSIPAWRGALNDNNVHQHYKIHQPFQAFRRYYLGRTIHQYICCLLRRVLLSMPTALGILVLDIQVLPDNAHQINKDLHQIQALNRCFLGKIGHQHICFLLCRILLSLLMAPCIIDHGILVLPYIAHQISKDLHQTQALNKCCASKIGH